MISLSLCCQSFTTMNKKKQAQRYIIRLKSNTAKGPRDKALASHQVAPGSRQLQPGVHQRMESTQQETLCGLLKHVSSCHCIHRVLLSIISQNASEHSSHLLLSNIRPGSWCIKWTRIVSCVVIFLLLLTLSVPSTCCLLASVQLCSFFSRTRTNVLSSIFKARMNKTYHILGLELGFLSQWRGGPQPVPLPTGPQKNSNCDCGTYKLIGWTSKRCLGMVCFT